MTYRVSPGIYPQIVDLAIGANYISPSIAAVAFGAKRGPLSRTFVSDRTKLRALYGLSDPTWGSGIDSLDAFLLEGTQSWAVRAVSNDAKYSLGLVANNFLGSVPAGTSYSPVPGGSLVPYNEVNRDVKDVVFSTAFLTGTSTIITINTVATSSIAFSTSHEDLIARAVQAVQNVLDGMAEGGYAVSIPTGSTTKIIRIIGPQDVTLDVSVSTTGTSAPVGSIVDTDWLAFVTSENPGAWGNNIAVGTTNVDSGISQKIKVSFGAGIVASNIITLIINGLTVTTTYATSNNATLDALCAAYELAFPGGTATAVSTGTANNRQIILTAPDASTNLAITSAAVTAGASQSIVTFSEILKAVPSKNTFDFVVYEGTNFRTPNESWNVSYADGVDGMGNQLGFDFAINEGPSKSTLVNVYTNPLFSGKVNGATNVTNSNYPRYLSGGEDGSLPDNGTIVNAWEEFRDPEKVTVRILINAGYATPEVQQQMVNICEFRSDCVAVLDVPSNKQVAQDAYDYRRNEMNIDSKFGALYSPDVLVFDRELGKRRYYPPSGLVAAQYAYTDRVTHEWFAAAGLTRGIIKNALGLRVVYGEGDRDLLSSAQINAIRHYNGRFPIWGEYSTQYAFSPLQSIPVVRMLITLQSMAVDTVAYSVFNPNDPYLWHQISSSLIDLCDPIKQARGIDYFKVVCDETNNGPTTQDQRVVKAAMWIKPTLSALYIRLSSVITKHTADFDIEIKASAGEY